MQPKSDTKPADKTTRQRPPLKLTSVIDGPFAETKELVGGTRSS